MNGKVKYGICKGECSQEEEKAIYARGLCQSCYWRDNRNKNAIKRGNGKKEPNKATGIHDEQYKISQISKKRLKELATYRPLRDKFMKENPVCQFKDCSNTANDLHHKARRGKNLCNVETFMAVCRACHDWIENNHAKSVELGYLI